MAVDGHAVSTSVYHDTTADIGTNTNRRDVSEMLDLWAHKDTPFLNRLSWGPESGGLNIEWVTEHLGFGYVTPTTGQSAGTGSSSIVIGTSDIGAASTAARQITSGTLLFGYDSAGSEYALMWVQSLGSSYTVTYEFINSGTGSEALSMTTTTRLYIIGSVANEGSAPRDDRSRVRSVVTNAMAILREDVQITGSMAATDFHAVENELKHQIRMRLKEMQLHRERLVLMSESIARSSTVAGLFDGCFGWLKSVSGNHISTTSADFTETAVNDMAYYLYDNGSTPDILVGDASQMRKFTAWDRAKIRTTPDARIAGHFVTHYLTDTGTEIEIIMMRKFPHNIAFMVDSSKLALRAKKGRKLLLQKLGLDGDREKYQMISEFSFEMRQYDQGAHGMWSKLAA